MSVILALVTAAVLVIMGMARTKKAQKHAAPVLVKRYVHPGHGWARMTDDGDVFVGMDDFAQSLIGSIDEVKLPRLLHRVVQGSAAWRVWHGHRLVAMVSPVTGRVIEKNEMVLRNPSLINMSPYGDGWLFKVRPRNVSSQLHNLFTGKAAHLWQDTVKARLVGFFSGTPALMYQDGGVVMKDLADRCSDEEWHAVTSEFFLVDEPWTAN
jgi:glycine cleavage system H protein